MPRRNGLGTKYLKVTMLHNIEDFCNKIISVADQAKRLKEESKSGHNAERSKTRLKIYKCNAG